jgi:hypothetical protein
LELFLYIVPNCGFFLLFEPLYWSGRHEFQHREG